MLFAVCSVTSSFDKICDSGADVVSVYVESFSIAEPELFDEQAATMIKIKHQVSFRVIELKECCVNIGEVVSQR